MRDNKIAALVSVAFVVCAVLLAIATLVLLALAAYPLFA